MKKSQSREVCRRLSAYFFLFALCAAACVAPSARAQDRMTIEEIIAKHRDSVGAAETLSSINSRLIGGTVLATFRSAIGGQIAGRSVMASQGTKSLIGMVFDNSTYPFEKIAYDGSTVTGASIRPGTRAPLTDFILTHNAIFTQGLLGGTLSSAWPLLNPADRNPRMEYAGTQRIGNIETYKVRFLPRGSSDLRIMIFIEQGTFRHVRTEYERVIAAAMGRTIDESAQQRETRYRLVEEFSDFRRESGLTLPHTYKLSFTINGPNNTFTADWVLTFTQFRFNQRLGPTAFDANATS